MNQMIATLSNMDLFDIAATPTGDSSFGADQNWYQTEWQRTSGCGPTTASNMFYYLSHTNDNLCRQLYGTPVSKEKESLLALMEELWKYVTPTKMGVYTTALFQIGIQKYAESKEISLSCRTFEVNTKPFRRGIQLENFISFIQDGLTANCPVGFLNLSKGSLTNLHPWHWVNLLTLEQDEEGNYFCLGSDEGVKRWFNMKLWFETSNLGGGLAYLAV